jgi:hypothetical protein
MKKKLAELEEKLKKKDEANLFTYT